jgi:5'-nucleotidase
LNLDGTIARCPVQYGDRVWEGYSVSATPAMAVEFAIQELATRPVDLVVSGINYGENIGTCITVSGTIGAALEAAERGVKAMAVSLETGVAQCYEHDESVDFQTAAYFVNFFASRLLGKTWPEDVDVLKVEIPMTATPQSPWMVAVQDRISYYTPKISRRSDVFADAAQVEVQVAKGQYTRRDTDAYALAQGCISITPLSLDNTSRVIPADLKKWIE